MSVQSLAATPETHPAQAPPARGTPWSPWSARTMLFASIGAGVLLASGVLVAEGTRALLVWVSLAIGMVYGVRAAWLALRHRRVDIDVLMVVGASLAAGVGHPEEGALLLVLFTFAGALEELAMARTRREVEALHAIMPDRAFVRRNAEWIEATPDDLRAGDELRIRPGDRVPTDAIVTTGASSMDQASLTGESLPRAVRPGDEIYAGTINGEGVLEARATRPASESSLQRVLALVVEARAQREPLQRAIDRLGQPYTLGVLSLSTLVFVVWWLGFREPLWSAASTAITLLIVASPCALVIATPTATLAAIARGARAGVLFKGGESLDRLSRARSVCFDKTGTLTKGRPAFEELVTEDGARRDEILGAAGALEGDSTHPAASAIVKASLAAGQVATAVGARAVSGLGMEGVVDGRRARIGARGFVAELLDERRHRQLAEVMERARAGGSLAVGVALAGEGGGAPAWGVITLRDQVREGGAGLVHALHELGIRPVRMLTGDDPEVARRVAGELGLDAWDASLRPEQKVEIVRTMRAGGTRVAVIGDGVNDAPALAAADVSVAIGSIGSAAALESADIVLLSDDLARVPWAIRLARSTRATVLANLMLALGVIVVMGLATVIGSRTGLRVPMSVGVLAHEGGTVIVVLNSLRLLWFRGRARAG